MRNIVYRKPNRYHVTYNGCSVFDHSPSTACGCIAKCFRFLGIANTKIYKKYRKLFDNLDNVSLEDYPIKVQELNKFVDDNIISKKDYNEVRVAEYYICYFYKITDFVYNVIYVSLKTGKEYYSKIIISEPLIDEFFIYYIDKPEALLMQQPFLRYKVEHNTLPKYIKKDIVESLKDYEKWLNYYKNNPPKESK